MKNPRAAAAVIITVNTNRRRCGQFNFHRNKVPTITPTAAAKGMQTPKILYHMCIYLNRLKKNPDGGHSMKLSKQS